MAQTTLGGVMDGYDDMEANTLKDLKKVKQRVRHILEKHPATRGNDVLLLFYYYKVFEPNVKWSFRQFKELLAMTSPESITRCRRLYQHNGEFLPTERTVRKRRRREEIIREGIDEV